MAHRTGVPPRRGFAFLLFIGVTQASKSALGTWWTSDRYLLSEGNYRRAAREASAELAERLLHTRPCSLKVSIFSAKQHLVSLCRSEYNVIGH